MPTHIAEDGSNQVYTLHVDGPNRGRFSASADGGLTWRLRGQQFGGLIRQLVVSPADARALYVLVRKPVTESSGDYTIFYSADEGATWTQRAAERIEGEGFASVWLETFPGPSAPVAMLLRQKSFGSGSNGYRTTERSIDGGATFREVARNGRDRGAQIFRTNLGLLRLNRILYGYTLEASGDNGGAWQPRPLPELVKPRPDGPPHETVEITQFANAANTLVVGDFKGSGDLWLSQDAGASWTPLARNMRFITPVPYAPHTLLGFEMGSQRRPGAIRLPQDRAISGAQPLRWPRLPGAVLRAQPVRVASRAGRHAL